MALRIQRPKQALDYWPSILGPRPVERRQPVWLEREALEAMISETLRQQVEAIRAA